MAGSFLQSREWESFQRAVGRDTWRVEGVLVIRHDLPMGLHYLYCPRPDIRIKSQELRTSDFFDKVKKIAAQEKSVFLKIDPIDDIFFRASSIQHSASSLQPQETSILDLTKSEEELLGAMHEKTRYNIRLAARKGVAIGHFQFSISDSQFAVFWKLLQETAARDGFRTHPRAYYKKLLDTHSDCLTNELFFATYQGVVIASALVNFYRSPTSAGDAPSPGVATYLHGASSREYREVMAPHLLHWRIMEEARRRGFGWYDLWGIDEERWPGVTRFKLGFGGMRMAYSPGVAVVYRPLWYQAYMIRRFFFKKKD